MTPISSPDPRPAGEKRAPGRPPKTSREAIVACAIAILEKEPRAGISLNRIAREIEIAPMAIYNYFANRDELLQAVTERMMAGLVFNADPAAPWQDKVSAWAETVRAHFQRYPHLIHLLTWEGHASTAWLKHALLITELLADAGLHGRALSRATLWTWNSIMGAINSELSEQETPRTLDDNDVAQLEEPLRGHMKALHDFTKSGRHHDDMFQYNLERTLEALAGVIERERSR
jgi:AcrR family transcriptional regulator